MARRIFLRQFKMLALAAVALVALGSVLVFRASAQDDEPAFVRLVVEYGSGVEKHFNEIAHEDGLTVFGAMRVASALPEPLALGFEHRGRGETVFVRSIDGLANEGGNRGDRNWTYLVNGERASRSCGVEQLEAGDVVRWRYAPYNMGE